MNNFLLAIVIVFVLLISIIKYFEDRFCLACLVSARKIISAVLGATIVAIFTEMLDGIYFGIHDTNPLFVLIMPLAFIVFLFLHQHIFSHKDNQKKSVELNMMVKTITSLSDVLIGVLAFTQMQNSILSEIIFLGILLSYELIEQLSLHIIHEESGAKKTYGLFSRILFSIFPLIGFSYAYFIGVSETASVVLLAVYGGTLFSLMIREILSQERKMIPAYFLTGAGLFIILFLIDTSIF